MDDKEQRWSMAMREERLGNRVAYESLLKEIAASLRQMVRSQLQRMRLSAAETEDVIQEVLIAVHSRRHHWDPERPLIPWLNAIARYKLIDASRRLQREASRHIELRDEDWSHQFISEPLDISRSSIDVPPLN
jgi:RNA polymerase sigma-70 factor (ECF subfamily)